MGAFRDYLEGLGSDTEALERDAAEFLQKGAHMMIAEGQDPQAVFRKAFPIFGEQFLEKAGIVEIVAEQETR